MKLIMTLLVRDEQDIIQANIEFHRAQGVDFFIITDNLSVDNTKAILQNYIEQGLVHYIYEERDNYQQYEWVTHMARLAYTDFQADWVINNDADEFWWARSGNLKQSLLNLPAEINTVLAQRYNFVPLAEQNDKPFYQTMLYREINSLNPLGKPLPPKMAHRAIANIEVAQGNHSVSGFEQLKTAENNIDILHFPIRSYAQLLNKITKGGAAYQRNTILPEGIGITWRQLYKNYQEHQHLFDYYQQQVYDAEKLNIALNKGIVIEDKRLYEFFNN